ncbi:helix-turn-helix domain-containing protein [Enterovibrio norvegicus]|nr:sugar diacid recognition domain-containing protein [Enterovibrio norvegicus]MCC4799601.1 helix-turn-helix domain-containing protein [Enterovibrio norvegicus]
MWSLVFMKITPELAQAIVQRAIKIINNVLNVMDEQGYIIASTDSSRLHQRHEGAILAMSERRIIEINSDMQNNMHGVKPGVNLPIFFKEKAIGVIGISGQLDEVRQYGELVRMAAEMTVEHAFELEQLQWSEMRKEELVLQWLQYKPDAQHLSAIATRLKVNIQQTFGVALCHHDLSVDQHKLIKTLKKDNDNILTARFSESLLVVLIPLKGKKSESICHFWANQQEKLISHSASFSSNRWVFSQPAYYPNSVATEFSATCSLLNGLPNEVRSANTEALRFAALLNPISEQWQQEHIQKVLTPLFAKGENLRSTLVSWFEHNCDADKTAIALFVHPNTVRYRLRLAEECTGLTLSHFQDRGLLYAALTIRPSSQWIVQRNKK